MPDWQRPPANLYEPCGSLESVLVERIKVLIMIQSRRQRTGLGGPVVTGCESETHGTEILQAIRVPEILKPAKIANINTISDKKWYLDGFGLLIFLAEEDLEVVDR